LAFQIAQITISDNCCLFAAHNVWAQIEKISNLEFSPEELVATFVNDGEVATSHEVTFKFSVEEDDRNPPSTKWDQAALSVTYPRSIFFIPSKRQIIATYDQSKQEGNGMVCKKLYKILFVNLEVTIHPPFDSLLINPELEVSQDGDEDSRDFQVTMRFDQPAPVALVGSWEGLVTEPNQELPGTESRKKTVNGFSKLPLLLKDGE